VKEPIFHPEARAETRESFYEARLDGLGLRFLSAVEQTVKRITIHPEAGGSPHWRIPQADRSGLSLQYHLSCLGRLYLPRCPGSPSSSSGLLARTSRPSLTLGLRTTRESRALLSLRVMLRWRGEGGQRITPLPHREDMQNMQNRSSLLFTTLINISLRQSARDS
jgi:hypothetical protein